MCVCVPESPPVSLCVALVFVMVVRMCARPFPSRRTALYDATDGGKRLIRVMFSNIEDRNVVEHIFAALTNMWYTCTSQCPCGAVTRVV